MQGMVMGMNHVTTGLGALFGSAFYSAVALITDAAGNVHAGQPRDDAEGYNVGGDEGFPPIPSERWGDWGP